MVDLKCDVVGGEKRGDYKRRGKKMLPQWDVNDTILHLQICPLFYGKNVFANHKNRAI